MIEIEATCTTCGADFTPSHAAYVRGTWRTCPSWRTRCRDGPGDEVPAVNLDDSRPAQGRTGPPYYEAEGQTP